MAAAQDQRSYTTLAVIDGDARGMRSSDYAVVLRAVDRLRIAGLVSPPDGVCVAPRVHASAVRNASGSCWSWGFAGADGATTPGRSGIVRGYAHPDAGVGEGGRIDMKRQAQSRVSVLLAIMAAGAFVSFAFGQPSTNAAPQSNFVGGEPSRPDSSDIRALRLRFEAGVRSNWHSHAGWQILAAEEGRGRTQARDGEIIEMVPGGRAVFAPAGLVHWHGASPDEHVVQLTVLGGGDGGPTSWFGPVSEEEYRGQ